MQRGVRYAIILQAFFPANLKIDAEARRRGDAGTRGRGEGELGELGKHQEEEHNFSFLLGYFHI
ncbi:MAG: hypothetical protein F6K31_22615 [Symploca sp. SIO2G7]|nr:hypothetical protein [Symploca sp. SIO2G7]